MVKLHESGAEKSKERVDVSRDGLEKAARSAQERLQQRAEQAGERSLAEKDKKLEVESARHEVEVTAQSQERKKQKPEIRAKKLEVSTRARRKDSFDTIMGQTREQMSPASRTFSKVIHNPAVERVSEAAGKTVARPNAILAGSVSAFIVVLGVYLTARYFGYPLSGFETIAAFIAGWVLGIVFDFFKAMITGGR